MVVTDTALSPAERALLNSVPSQPGTESKKDHSNDHRRSPTIQTTAPRVRERQRHPRLAEWFAAGRPDTESTTHEPLFSTNGTGHPISQEQEDKMVPNEDPESEDDGYEGRENILT